MDDIHVTVEDEEINFTIDAPKPPSTFLGLEDVDETTFEHHGGDMVRVKTDESGIEFGVGAYTLLPATASVLGGVKQGSGVSIDANGVLSAAGTYTLPVATGSVLGGVKEGDRITIAADGTISADVQTTDISGKVDKVTGSSLVADTEIAKIHAAGSDNQDLSGKQDVLVSATNIKTINSNSLLGSGDLSIVSSGGIASSYIFCEDPMFNGVNASPLLYNVLTPYGANAVVISSFGLYWRSLQAGNAGNALAENAWWTRAWHELEKQSDGGTVGNHTVTTGNNVYVETDRYVTAALATTVIPAGNWKFIIYAKSSLIGLRMQMKADIYRVDSTGTISGTVLGTATTAIFNNPATVGIEASVYISEQTGWSLTDRIGIVISGRRTDDSGTLTWYHDVSQGWASEVNTPLSLLHNQMNGLNQGDYQHLTGFEKTALNAKADKSFAIAMAIAVG
jgi:hypothetical protein